MFLFTRTQLSDSQFRLRLTPTIHVLRSLGILARVLRRAGVPILRSDLSRALTQVILQRYAFRNMNGLSAIGAD